MANAQRVMSIIIKGYLSALFTSLVYTIWKMGRRGDREKGREGGVEGGGADVVDKFVSTIIVSSVVGHLSLSMKCTRVGFTPQMALDDRITIFRNDALNVLRKGTLRPTNTLRKGALRSTNTLRKGALSPSQYHEKGRSKAPSVS